MSLPASYLRTIEDKVGDFEAALESRDWGTADAIIGFMSEYYSAITEWMKKERSAAQKEDVAEHDIF